MVQRILKKIRVGATNSGKKIVYTEPNDERILKAAYEVYKKRYALPILVGDSTKIIRDLKKLKIPQSYFQIMDPSNSEYLREFAAEYFNLRKDKGVTREEALNLMRQSNYFGTMLLHKNKADCLISGASYTTAESLRPVFQIIKTKSHVKIASSFFLMVLENKVYLFADCSFVRNPNAEELSEIAVATTHTAMQFGLDPKVAMLSYSTKGSGFGDSPDCVRRATELAKKKLPGIKIDGELQLDAAIVPSVAKKKCSSSPLNGQANILIFPDLNSGNIGYKLVERLAKAKALGPISQGLNKQVDILSRGCSTEDIIDVSAITIFMSENNKPHFKSERHLLSK